MILSGLFPKVSNCLDTILSLHHSLYSQKTTVSSKMIFKRFARKNGLVYDMILFITGANQQEKWGSITVLHSQVAVLFHPTGNPYSLQWDTSSDRFLGTCHPVISADCLINHSENIFKNKFKCEKKKKTRN